jgi:phosphotransferase system enzyme I (PtsP)
MDRDKNNFELICGIGELLDSFDKTQSLDHFLAAVAGRISDYLSAEICSIYLFDEIHQEVVLRASKGLPPEAIGSVRLKLGEGITGAALKELRAILEINAATNRHFKFIPKVDDESFKAFAAIPITKGLARIGVLVLQHRKAGYFNLEDVKTLRLIASQLAMAIENARLLITLHSPTDLPPAPLEDKSPADPPTRFIKCKPASEGIAAGILHVMNFTADDWMIPPPEGTPAYTRADFERALRQTAEQIEMLQSQLAEKLTDTVSMIFNAHLLILKDGQFSGDILLKIDAGTPVLTALHTVMDNFLQIFSRSANPRIREKSQDLRDLCRRIAHNLARRSEESTDFTGAVIVAHELLPSDMLKLVAARVAGIILINSGATAHIAILARSLSIPMVLADTSVLPRLCSGLRVLMDAHQGNLFLEPDPTILDHYRHLIENPDWIARAAEMMQPTTHTRDGTRIKLLANINLLSDLKTAHRLKAEGIGLYRTEFPFLIRNDFPSEEDQYQIYLKINREMGEQEVVFRTLDIGGDKMLSYFPHLDEANPFLGLRAIRFSLRNRQIFVQQLRALLRAGIDRPLKIMFPLISSVDDLLLARSIVAQCIHELAAESIPHNARPHLGIMMEMPSAVAVADELTAEADFLSIGTNDLIQYLLAVDRTNKQISGWYQPHNPAVLRAIGQITAAALKHKKPISICGDMAAEPALIPFLIGVGLRTFSLQPTSLPKVQELIAQVDLRDAIKQADALLKMGRVSETARFLNLPAQWPE